MYLIAKRKKNNILLLNGVKSQPSCHSLLQPSYNFISDKNIIFSCG